MVGLRVTRLLSVSLALLLVVGGMPGTAAAQEGPSEETLGLEQIWENFYGFSIIVILFVGALGLAAGSLTMGSFGAFLAFVHIATGTGDEIMESVLYAALVVMFIGFAFKMWRFEGMGA